MEREEENESRDLIIAKYLELIASEGALPTMSTFIVNGVKRGKVRHHFGGIENLHEYMSKTHKEEIEKYFSTVDNVFSKNPSITKQRFIITTAVGDSPANLEFLSSMRNYCATNDAQILILPCESKTNSFEQRTAIFDKEFSKEDYTFIIEDTALNSKLSLCSIQVSANQVRSITGLNRIGNREGSYIFAAPKQFLEYVPSGHDKDKNYAIMTPGACTHSSYHTAKFISKRLSYIAQHDHTIGAIIVEIEDDNVFHFRQIQCDLEGSFVDLGVQYNADWTQEEVQVSVVLGDIHAAHADFDVLNSFIGLTRSMAVDKMFLHDIFDGYSVNHHVQTIGEKAGRALKGDDILIDELALTWDTIQLLKHGIDPETTCIVRSNHDEFLDRYLKEGRYIDDPINHLDAIKIAPSLFEDTTPLEYGLRWMLESKRGYVEDHIDDEFAGLEFLTRNSSIRVGGAECAAHGDLGLNGAKSSINSLEKVYGDCVTAHVHSAAIQRGVFRVGTFTLMDMGYNRGPSSWTHTGCLVYENGQRQLVNYVNGKFHKDQG